MNENIISTTLPIDQDGKLFLDLSKAKEFGSSLSNLYCSAEPYPHIVIDDFLPLWLINELLYNFPTKKGSEDNFFESEFSGLHKRQALPFNYGERVQNLLNFFNSSPFIRFIENLTKIEALIGDPHFGGGGFHEISRGGHLGVHADFRIQTELHLIRRINVLIYLNKDWKSEYGGELEIWDKKMSTKMKSISPIFNRCVIFNTDSHSYHGHPEPLNSPEDLTRKSIALYYYTASKKVYEENASHTTMYVARPNDSKRIKFIAIKLRIHNYLNDWLPPIGYRAFKKTMKFSRNILKLIKIK